MTRNQTVGEFGTSNDQCEHLTLVFSPLSAPLHARWRNNGLSADFLGDYVATFLPTENGASNGKHQAEIRHAVTYIANELLENAMKYHEHQVDVPIGLRLELSGESITVSASNGVGEGQAEHYRSFVERIASEDVADLLVKQLEDTAAASGSAQSCLGLLTMMNDYGARLGWHFEPHDVRPGMIMVTTRAILPLGNYFGARA